MYNHALATPQQGGKTFYYKYVLPILLNMLTLQEGKKWWII
jgi:hypothetical protein